MSSESTSAAPKRVSAKHQVIAAALEDFGDFRSAQDLHDALRHSGQKVGLATVYRILQTMTDEGLVDVLRADTGEATYRLCSAAHHHHLVCRRCGKTVEIEEPMIERWATTIAAQHGYTEPSHTVEIFGVCGDH